MKNFKIGDQVAVLDDTIKGLVTKVLPTAITIDTEDGFSMCFNPNELVLIEHDQKELSKFSDIHLNLLLNEKKAAVKKQVPSKKISIDKLPVMEVDLHIHHLVPSTRGMSNFEILSLQLDEAERKIQYAKSKKIQRMVFIHGVGEGVLQQELYAIFQKYKVDYYAASYQKYGMGATEIYIYQNSKE